MAYTIVVGLDGSLLAERILEPALELAKARAGELVLVRVRDPEEESELCQEYLERKKAVLGSSVPVTVEVLEGQPVKALVARSQAADLLCLCSHGRSGYDRFILGSVAENAVRRAECPCLVVRSNNFSFENTNRILVPLDGSELSERALLEAEGLARIAGATLVLCRVSDEARYQHSVLPNADRDEERERVLSYLRKVSAAFNDIETEQHHAFGSPARTLVEAVQSQNIDLVVLGSHGRTGPVRWLLGSVAENVMRSSLTPAVVMTK